MANANLDAGFMGRTAIAVVVGVAIAVVLLPFWIALIHYPVTQTPIPHPSRANYILSPQWGLNYFIVPYGALILGLPFIFLRGSMVVRLRPLLLGFWVAFLVGLGGTTPVGHLLLGRAFDVLTMERFSYWATLLAPVCGTPGRGTRRSISTVGGCWLDDISCSLQLCNGSGMGDLSPSGCRGLQGRYGRLVAQSRRTRSVSLRHPRIRQQDCAAGNDDDASSVDGEWNSGRMLPELTRYGAGALTSSKYFGEAGLDALRAMLMHADHYGLKWVFVRDHYYDPLLSFAGWRQVDSLEDKTITVWSKDGVPPACR
jgi:hypothetical protein